MEQLNKIAISGVLIKQAELKTTPKGHTMSTFTLLFGKSFKNPDGSWSNANKRFLDCVAFKDCAQSCLQIPLKKPIIVEGALAIDEWNDKETGKKRSKPKIIVSSWREQPQEQKSTYGVGHKEDMDDISVENLPF